MRVSPDGTHIAFLETYGGKDDVVVLDPKTRKPNIIARGWEHGTNGLAWKADGKEIWITGTGTAAPPSLYAINIDTGDTRLVTRLTGSMKLYDIAANGRLYLTDYGAQTVAVVDPATPSAIVTIAVPGNPISGVFVADTLWVAGLSLWKCTGCTEASPTWIDLARHKIHPDQHALAQVATTGTSGPLKLQKFVHM